MAVCKYYPGIRPKKEASHVLATRLKKAMTLSVASTRHYETTKPPNITDINAEIRTKWHLKRSAFVESYITPAFSVHYHKDAKRIFSFTSVPACSSFVFNGATSLCTYKLRNTYV